MKSIKINQNALGNYYFGDHERQHSFSMSIYEDNAIVVVDGKKATASFIVPESDHVDYILEADKYQNLSDNFEEILDLCAKKVYGVISTHDYKGELFAFLKMYKVHFNEIDDSLVSERKEYLNKKLAEIQNLLGENSIIPQPDDVINYIRPIKKRIETIDSLIKSYSKNMEDLKEESDSFKKIDSQINVLEEERNLINYILKNQSDEN